jgi:hypothetical protein
VPPEVTVADLVVVVGVVVVVVVVVVLVVFVVLVEGDVVLLAALLALEDEEPVRDAVLLAALLVPGCSLETRRPMRAVDAVAATMADWVIRRRRRRARCRDWGELAPSVSFITSSDSFDDMMKAALPTLHPVARLVRAVSSGPVHFSQSAFSRRTTEGDSAG